MNWFERLTGFAEQDYESTKARLEVRGDRLVSRVNGKSYRIGRLETPTLAELRERARGAIGAIGGIAGPLSVSAVTGDVRRLHAEPQNAGALFQVASQFNLLEMVGPDVTPEDGVARYEHDQTQGPACAIAAGAATIYRNYFVPVDGRIGQTREVQIDCLRDLGAALGQPPRMLWEMCNGYALCTESGLKRVAETLEASDGAQRSALRDRLRVGLHRDVEVTDGAGAGHHVSQVFCSALPVAYSSIRACDWEPFARLVLEGAYEATLWAGVLNAQCSGSRRVFLTMLGGGAFGNAREWILDALDRALGLVADIGLDVRMVGYGELHPDVDALLRRSSRAHTA